MKWLLINKDDGYIYSDLVISAAWHLEYLKE